MILCISFAQSSAFLEAWPLSYSAGKRAIIASPTYFSKYPPYSEVTRLISCENTCNIVANFSGDSATILHVFSQEMSLVTSEYGGYVLKYMGDAIIALFPAEYNSSQASKNAVDCAKD